jgi:hypothetical protein
VKLSAQRADHLGQSALDRHVDVLVGVAELELSALQLASDGIEPFLQTRQLLVGEQARTAQGPGVGARAANVLRPQTAVEGDRRVQPPEQRILSIREAGHRRQFRRRTDGRPPRRRRL